MLKQTHPMFFFRVCSYNVAGLNRVIIKSMYYHQQKKLYYLNYRMKKVVVLQLNEVNIY